MFDVGMVKGVKGSQLLPVTVFFGFDNGTNSAAGTTTSTTQTCRNNRCLWHWLLLSCTEEDYS